MSDTSLQNAERGDEVDSELAGIRDVISHVYKSVWEDFSVWEQDHCRRTLKSLSRPVRTHLNPLPMSSGQSQSTLEEPPSRRDGPSTVAESFDDWDITNSSKSTLYVTDVQTIKEDQLPQPPSYESCTPISRNLMVGDDSDFLPFIPNSDDPTYDYTYDIDEHKYFAWHQPNRDPDLEVINIETTRSLLQDYEMTPADIDRSGILPLLVDQIIKSGRRRDMPKWRSHGPSANLPRLVTSTADRPKEILDYFLSTFCNNFNCMTGYCTTHLVDTHLPNAVPPKISYSKTHESVREPCGLECFLQAASSSNNIASFWTQKDIETLFAILEYSPDTLPCDLAIICRKPCREVYRHRTLYRGPPQSEKGKQVSHCSFEESVRVFVPNRPCKHDGPCDSRSNCPCFVNKAHCRSTCRCVKTCQRRWKGCTCAKTEKPCGTKKCSCFRAGVECDPEVCLLCGTKDELSNLCKNSGIRRGEFKRTQVRQSTWGLGLFMSESCQKGDLISEYIGELIFEPTLHSRDGVAVHKGRSYVFELNSTFSLDSSSAGNETRYINHSSTPNCNTTIMLVNGEHRIGIYASNKILQGEELFIDYGPKFFPTNTQEREKEVPTALPSTYYTEHASDSTYSNVSRDEGSSLD
ncbi:SET domain-containing protein [Phlegmacium glaucopus]|nr:SET domain-containing protein [Phlegmacium glaucopus]